MMKNVFLPLVALLFACGGSEPPTKTPNEDAPAKPAPGSEVPRDSKECGYVAGDKCFKNGKDACAYAGCAEDTCLQAESFPVQIRCKNK